MYCSDVILHNDAASEEVCSHGDLRLMDGDFSNEGRVEICMDNHWGSVCNSLFDVNDATVICNQLGYTNGKTYTYIVYCDCVYVYTSVSVSI